MPFQPRNCHIDNDDRFAWFGDPEHFSHRSFLLVLVNVEDGQKAEGAIEKVVFEFEIEKAPVEKYASEGTLEPWNSNLRRRSRLSRGASESDSPVGCAKSALDPMRYAAESYCLNRCESCPTQWLIVGMRA